MATTEYADVQSIHDFKSLLRYLRKELKWPIDEETPADELSFDYKALELGLDEQHAVKVKQIKQLRPLTSNQPWGVFWIEFEPKRLPVVVMRRILSKLVSTQREKKAHQKTWDLPDLMFVSATGSGNERGISFAHFEDVDGKRELRTFSWDLKESHLYYIKNLNLDALRWPANAGKDADAWRKQWATAFTVPHGYVPKTAEALSKEMARIARDIRDAVLDIYKFEHVGRGPLHKLHLNLKLDLISDLSEGEFADMYAQTVTYGLFAARATRTGSFGGGDAKALIEHTNPFLRELLEQMMNQQSLDLDELGVTELTELLGRIDVEAILQDFGRQKKGEDPVIHFYETFMREYDPQQKTRRGEFYTPDPVVSFIVRSVDYLLKTEFDLPDGLAAAKPNAQGFEPVILDPATGTGTFLKYVVEVIWENFYEKNKKLSAVARRDKWNDFVRQYVLPRLFAFELKMSPYTIAHMKVGLALQEKGFDFKDGERLQIYLTNALQPAHEIRRVDTAALAHEADKANEVKSKAAITVIIGNPPYSNFGMMNKGPWILELLGDYKRDLDEKKLNLDDDFIKFMRFGQWRLDKTGTGILAFITNNTYIDGVTHRRMRHSLMESFDEIYILDLHGSTKRQQASSSMNKKDENVFDIQQGVSIGIFVKTKTRAHHARVFHAPLWGTREVKYDVLLTSGIKSIEWQELVPKEPYYFFAPQAAGVDPAEYERSIPLKDVFLVAGNGVKTERDFLTIHFTADELRAVVTDFSKLPDGALRQKYSIGDDSRDWKLSNAKGDARENIGRFAELSRRIYYRPFDLRHTFYTGNSRGFIGTPGRPTMHHMIAGENLGLLTCRQQAETGFQHVLCTKDIAECCAVSLRTREITSLFPLYIYPASFPSQRALFAPDQGGWGRRANFTAEFRSMIEGICGLQLAPEGFGDWKHSIGPVDVFHYIYSILHSPTYRKRYAEFLKIDFPRIPLTGNFSLLRQLCGLGSHLVSLHLLEDKRLGSTGAVKFHGKQAADVQPGYPKYDDCKLYVNSEQYFDGVSAEVWNFQIGSYQVCEKWLKDRRGRELSKDDIEHYKKIVVALGETIRIMKEIDEVIDAHGGWPIK